MEECKTKRIYATITPADGLDYGRTVAEALLPCVLAAFAAADNILIYIYLLES